MTGRWRALHLHGWRITLALRFAVTKSVPIEHAATAALPLCTGIAKAQTYNGATAISTTDSVGLNRGGDAVAISNNVRTTRTGTMRGASTAGSMGVTSNQAVGSKALTGAANGAIVLAQANEAVALAQGERA